MSFGTGIPNPIDVHVGGRVRLRRTLLGLSQEKLGEAIGLTFQQVQKYERGANRIGASRLFDLSRVLDVPVGYFFDDMSDDVAARSPRQIRGFQSVAAQELTPASNPWPGRRAGGLRTRSHGQARDFGTRAGLLQDPGPTRS